MTASQLWWHVARVSGLLSWLLLAASCLWGLLLSTRVLGRRPSRPWLLDMHRFLSTIGVSGVALHVAALWLDSYVQFGVADLFVPMASPWRPGAVAHGIVALYLLAAIQVTSLVMARLPRRAWWVVHVTSLACLTLATVHGLLAGTDRTNVVVWLVMIVALAEVALAVAVRVVYRRQAWRAPPVG